MKKAAYMYKPLALLAACVMLLPTFGGQAATAGNTNNTNQTIVYRVHLDGKKQEKVAVLPAMHDAFISPGGRFVYTVNRSFRKDTLNRPYLYDTKTQTLTELPGFAKWLPKQDELLLVEQESLYRYNPATKKKVLLAQGSKSDPITDYAVSPDERYLAFVQTEVSLNHPELASRLFLVDMQSLKRKVNDRYAASQTDGFQKVPLVSWSPTSKKVFYRVGAGLKELDLPTGRKYTYAVTAFPSYSSDMKWRFERKDGLGYMTDLLTGKSAPTGELPQSIERSLTEVYWSPVGHSYVAKKFYHSSNAQDSYEQLTVRTGTKAFVYPLDGSLYLSDSDNIRFIGWARDGQSFYVADLDSVH
ncbi:MAG: TolB family protein, partial [Clostridia bacterium]